jgi:hypothetical protein
MESYSDLIVYVVMGIFFYSLTKSVAGYILDTKIRNSIKEALNELVHEVKVENNGPVYYWFDKDTDAFLGQGMNEEEVINHVKSRFPNHMFIIPEKGVLAGPEWKFTKKFLTIIERDV